MPATNCTLVTYDGHCIKHLSELHKRGRQRGVEIIESTHAKMTMQRSRGRCDSCFSSGQTVAFKARQSWPPRLMCDELKLCATLVTPLPSRQSRSTKHLQIQPAVWPSAHRQAGSLLQACSTRSQRISAAVSMRWRRRALLHSLPCI